MTQGNTGVAKLDGRSKEARARRQAERQAERDRPTRRASMAEIEQQLLAHELDKPDVVAALHAVEAAELRRNSVSRKLCCGSHAVTVQDLALWERKLAEATKQLTELAAQRPALWAHPRLAHLAAQAA